MYIKIYMESDYFSESYVSHTNISEIQDLVPLKPLTLESLVQSSKDEYQDQDAQLPRPGLDRILMHQPIHRLAHPS